MRIKRCKYKERFTAMQILSVAIDANRYFLSIATDKLCSGFCNLTVILFLNLLEIR